MEFLIEELLDLLFEGSMELSANKKVPKWIRYPLIVLIILVFLFAFGIMLFVSILLLKENILVSIIFFILDIILLIAAINKFKKLYFEKKQNGK